VQITDAEIDRAIAAGTRETGVQVLLSELILRADSPEARAAAETVARRLAGQMMGEGAFAAEARANSAAPSREIGGRLDWLPLGNLPPPVAAEVLGLAPGQVSQPIPVPNAVILFLLRDLRETGRPEAQVLALDWAEYDVANAAEAARVKGEVDTCDDLYGVAKGQPETRLRRETRTPAEVPGDVAMELAKLDDNEGTAFVRDGRPMFLMLCARSNVLPGDEPGAPVAADENAEGQDQAAEGGTAPPDAQTPGPDRAQVRAQLFNQRLSAYADGYLAELKADATIWYP
jgi:peptidyl-prolyl cis-trans isomerase SurA